MIARESLAAVDADDVEERAGDEEVLGDGGGEVERREDAQEDGEESAGGDDNDVDEHVEEPTTVMVLAFPALLTAVRCFLPAACLSRRRCLSG